MNVPTHVWYAPRDTYLDVEHRESIKKDHKRRLLLYVAESFVGNPATVEFAHIDNRELKYISTYMLVATTDLDKLDDFGIYYHPVNDDDFTIEGLNFLVAQGDGFKEVELKRLSLVYSEFAEMLSCQDYWVLDKTEKAE